MYISISQRTREMPVSEDLAEHPLRDRDRHERSGHLAELGVPLAVALVGAVLLFAGFWGASGSTNPGVQIPYLASGTIPGAALVISAAVLLLRVECGRAREEAAGVAGRLDALVEWLVSASEAPDEREDNETVGADSPRST